MAFAACRTAPTLGVIRLHCAMQQIAELVRQVAAMLEGQWQEITRTELECVDGNVSAAHPACTSGSFIYVAYENQQVLYVGETSKSVRRRFIGDGSGSHRQKNTGWNPRTTHICFIKKTHEELPEMERRLLEQALSIHLKPEFYSRPTKK